MNCAPSSWIIDQSEFPPPPGASTLASFPCCPSHHRLRRGTPVPRSRTRWVRTSRPSRPRWLPSRGTPYGCGRRSILTTACTSDLRLNVARKLRLPAAIWISTKSKASCAPTGAVPGFCVEGDFPGRRGDLRRPAAPLRRERVPFCLVHVHVGCILPIDYF